MVTGAGSGIGLALSRGLGLAGARVLMADLAEDRLGQAVSGLREIGLEVEGVTMDVSDAGSLECLAEQAFSADLSPSSASTRASLAPWENLPGAST